ncbi:hypothetical protein CH063_08950, partial [Colletotrichum higginsianum]
MRFSTSALASAVFFAFFADARYHDSCTCHNGGTYNWRLTTKACDSERALLAQQKSWGSVQYDTPSGRCRSVGVTDLISGDDFETPRETEPVHHRWVQRTRHAADLPVGQGIGVNDYGAAELSGHGHPKDLRGHTGK